MPPYMYMHQFDSMHRLSSEALAQILDFMIWFLFYVFLACCTVAVVYVVVQVVDCIVCRR